MSVAHIWFGGCSGTQCKAPGTPQYQQSRCERKKVEMLFAHLKRIVKLDRLRLRGLSGAHDEFLLAVTAQNLRRLAKRLWKGYETHAGATCVEVLPQHQLSCFLPAQLFLILERAHPGDRAKRFLRILVHCLRRNQQIQRRNTRAMKHLPPRPPGNG